MKIGNIKVPTKNYWFVALMELRQDRRGVNRSKSYSRLLWNTFISLHIAVYIGFGASVSQATSVNGTAMSWGENNFGHMGDGTTKKRNLPSPMGVPTGLGITDVAAVSTSGSYTLILRSDGSLLSCGSNFGGELGDGTTTHRTIPVMPLGLSNSVVAISAGGEHSLALRSDGSVWGWGWNQAGQVGDGTKVDCLAPVQVSGLPAIRALSAGYSHSLALSTDGTVWAWGYNATGELGDGTTTERLLPVRVSGLSDIIAVAAGESFSLALKSDGTVWGWGWNFFGPLGNEAALKQLLPIRIDGIAGIRAISAGPHFSLALKTDGTVWALGENSQNELGDGTTVDQTSPVQVAALSNVKALSCHQVGGLAIKEDGSLWGWGDGQLGLVGDTGQSHYPTPVKILSEVMAVSGGRGSIVAVVKPTVSVDDMTVQEGNSGTTTAAFTVRLLHPLTETVSVRYQTTSGTARAGSDFTQATGTVTIPAGETVQTAVVQVTGDTVRERDEDFYLNLSVPTFAALARNAAIGLIANDELSYSITGRVANHSGVGIASILVGRSGGSSVVTDANGYYSFINIAPGTYSLNPILTPAVNGVTFSPPSRSITVTNFDLTNMNFNAAFTVSGRVSNSSGAGMGNLLVTRYLGSSAVTSKTDSNGYYTFPNVRSGAYSVAIQPTAATSNFSYSPSLYNVTVRTTNQTNINFVVFFTVSGRVTESNGTPVPNVLVRCSTPTSSTSNVTDSNGVFKFSGVRSGKYTLTPTKAGKSFSPTAKPIEVGVSNIKNIMFVQY